METMLEKEFNEVMAAVAKEPWANEVKVIIINDWDVCIDITNCKDRQEEIEELIKENWFDVHAIFEDEYFYCEYCNRYHWNSDRVVVGEYSVACKECLSWAEKDNPDLADEYLAGLIDNDRRANEYLSKEYLESNGFERVDDSFDNGLYAHNHNDNPYEIMVNFQREGFEVVFDIDESNPYEVEFSVYIREV